MAMNTISGCQVVMAGYQKDALRVIKPTIPHGNIIPKVTNNVSASKHLITYFQTNIKVEFHYIPQRK